MTTQYTGFRYIYHYHIFHGIIQDFEKNIEKIKYIIPTISNTHIESFYSKGIGSGTIEEKINFINANQHKDTVINYAKNYYHINEVNFLNFLGKDIYSDFTSFLLSPLIFVVEDKAFYSYMTLKIFKQGYFYIEISDELDHLEFLPDNYNILMHAKKEDYILYPVLNKDTLKIEYEKKEYDASDEDNLKIEFPITQYYKDIVKEVECLFGSSTSDSFYTLFILDNNVISDKKLKEEEYKSLVTAPLYPTLGNGFHNNIPQYNFNHFTIVGNINRLAFNINNNKYNISTKNYKKEKLKYRAINNAFIMAALNSLYIKKAVLKFKANKTYSDDVFNDLEQRYIESILIKGLIQGYSINYLPTQYLRDTLEKEFTNQKEFEEIQSIYDQYLLVLNSRRQNKIEQQVKMSNIIIFILTCLSIIDIFVPFITDKIILASTTTFFTVFILVIYVIYSLKVNDTE